VIALTWGKVRLRPVCDDDKRFLARVYASTREDELALVHWSDAQKNAFLEMQFNAQHEHYQRHYTEADFQLILVDDQPAGRLYVARWNDEIRIVDIALLPEFRGHGIGSQLIMELLDEGSRSGKNVSIHVEVFNPAFRLYKRLGFEIVEDKGVYQLMEWRPGSLRQDHGIS
jgi:ribosomal protein S18 acetylase RimI-like enzyme